MYEEKKTIHDESALSLPPEIAEVCFTFPRDIDKVHELDLPTLQMPVRDLFWHLKLPFFWQPGKPFSLKPEDVISDPSRYPEYHKKILEVDTSYPIDIMWWKERWVIMDGLHRLCQEVLKGKVFVSVRQVPPEWKERIMPG